MTSTAAKRVRIPLTQGKWALVSPEDAQAAKSRPWCSAEHTKASGRYKEKP